MRPGSSAWGGGREALQDSVLLWPDTREVTWRTLGEEDDQEPQLGQTLGRDTVSMIVV